MVCKFCSQERLVKSGFVRSKQRYVCRGCGKHQVVGDKRVKYDNSIRKQALAMYLNSSGLRSIGRVLGVPFQLASINSKLDHNLETVFLTASESTHFISSRFVKQIARLGGDISGFVSERVTRHLSEYYKV